jgi:hypothetical protein
MPSTGARERVLVPLAAGLVAALSVAPRVLLAAGALPSGLRPFVWSDALFTYERGLSGHRVPYLDTPFEYPPVVGILSGVFSLASDRAAVYVALWGIVVVVAATATAAILVRAAGPRRTLLYFALTPELLLLSGINFDLLATGFFAGALVAARGGREGLSVASLGLGTATKLFPAAAAPLAVLRGRNRLAVGALFVGVLAALYAPTSLGARGASSSVGFYLFGIAPNLDSPWGIVARALDVTVSSGGWVVLVVTLVGLAVTYALAVVPRARTADPIALYALAVLTLMLWSRLYSPQYSLWALPLFVLLPLGGRLFALLAAADTLVYLTIYPLTLVRWSPDDLVPTLLLGLLVIGVGARHLALVLSWRAVRRLSA